MWTRVGAGGGVGGGAFEESARGLAATVLNPAQGAVVAIAGRTGRLSALLAQAELYGRGVGASDVRVIWVDEKPWRLGLAHSRENLVVCTIVAVNGEFLLFIFLLAH
jgi:hypothetical protein